MLFSFSISLEVLTCWCFGLLVRCCGSILGDSWWQWLCSHSPPGTYFQIELEKRPRCLITATIFRRADDWDWLNDRRASDSSNFIPPLRADWIFKEIDSGKTLDEGFIWGTHKMVCIFPFPFISPGAPAWPDPFHKLCLWDNCPVEFCLSNGLMQQVPPSQLQVRQSLI